MNRTRLTIYGIAMVLVLLALGFWQNGSEKVVTPKASPAEVVNLMPYSSEWNLEDSQKALVVLVYTPDEVSAKEMDIFSEVAKRHGPEIRFAVLNLTRNHPSYSNSVYAEFYGISKSPTFIIRRNGESDYHKHSGSMSAEELEAFIEFSLNNAAPVR